MNRKEYWVTGLNPPHHSHYLIGVSKLWSLASQLIKSTSDKICYMTGLIRKEEKVRRTKIENNQARVKSNASERLSSSGENSELIGMKTDMEVLLLLDR